MDEDHAGETILTIGTRDASVMIGNLGVLVIIRDGGGITTTGSSTGTVPGAIATGTCAATQTGPGVIATGTCATTQTGAVAAAKAVTLVVAPRFSS
jgi:hypothetical protein